MSNTTETPVETAPNAAAQSLAAQVAIEQKDEYIVLSSRKDREKEENELVGRALKLKFPAAKDAKIFTENPPISEVKGKIIVGSLIPQYLQEAAKEVVVCNTQSFYNMSANLRSKSDEEDAASLFNYEDSFTVTKTDVTRHKSEDGVGL